MANEGITQFQMTYEISPITLVMGIASTVPGNKAPIIAILQPGMLPDGLLAPTANIIGKKVGGKNVEPYAHFAPIPGSTLIENQIGDYPFANQSIAANAIIAQPLRISLLMTAPAPAEGGYNDKITNFTFLQQSLYKHTTSGGWFTVATPSYIYDNCLLTALRDVSGSETIQVQTRWQWDFIQPLLTLQQASAAQNSLISAVSNGGKTVPAWTGAGNAPPSSGITPSVVPSSQNLNSTNPTIGSGAPPIAQEPPF